MHNEPFTIQKKSCTHKKYNQENLNFAVYKQRTLFIPKTNYMHRTENIFKQLLQGERVAFTHTEYASIKAASQETRRVLTQINNESEDKKIKELFSKILAHPLDDTSSITPPLYTNYGRNIRIGRGVFINHACSFLDLAGEIIIDDFVLIGPRVNIATEEHPIEPQNRQQLFGKSVHIKRGAWIGAGATILSGVTIGENSVVAAGAVVSQNVPDNVVVAGVPAKIIKEIPDK